MSKVNTNEIIESGILEQYVLGNLTPNQMEEITLLSHQNNLIKDEVERIINILRSSNSGPKPKLELKSKILNTLNQLMNETLIDLNNPPIISAHSDRKLWIQAIKDLAPSITSEDYFIRPLFDNGNRTLDLVWLNTSLIEDEHEESAFKESFFILEGECECDFEGVIVRFKAGDYFVVPPKTRHIIRNISTNTPFVKGIVQRIAS